MMIMWQSCDLQTYLLLVLLNIVIREVAVELVVGTNLTLICSQRRSKKRKKINKVEYRTKLLSSCVHTEALNAGLAPSLRLKINETKKGVSLQFLWWYEWVTYTFRVCRNWTALNFSSLLQVLPFHWRGVEHTRSHDIYIYYSTNDSVYIPGRLRGRDRGCRHHLNQGSFWWEDAHEFEPFSCLRGNGEDVACTRLVSPDENQSRL